MSHQIGEFTGPQQSCPHLVSWLKNSTQCASPASYGLCIHLAGSDQIKHICPEDINQ